MNFFQRLIFAWRYAQLPSYDRSADQFGYWNAQDAERTLQYFNSPTGLKLRVLLNNFVFKNCYQACAALGNQDKHTGIARGTSLTVFHLQELITRGPAKEAEQTEPEGEAAAAVLDIYAA